VIDMRSLCTTKQPRVKTDASHLEIRPFLTCTAFAAARGFRALVWSVGTGDQPPEPTLAGIDGYTPSSSTSARGHTPSTPPAGARICRSTAIARHA